MVRLNGVNNGRVLFILSGNVHTNGNVAALYLVVQRLANVMQQAGTLCLGDVHVKLCGQNAGKICHFQRMVQHILAIAGAVVQAAQQLYNIGVQAVQAHVHHCFFALALHGKLQLAAAFINRLLNARGVDAPIADQALQRHAGNFAAHRVKAGKRDGLGRVINDKVYAGGCFQRADVAALAANDAALHFVRRQGHHRHGGLAGMVGRAAGNGLANQLARHGFGLVLCLRFIRGNVHGLFVGKLLVQFRQKQLLGIL